MPVLEIADLVWVGGAFGLTRLWELLRLSQIWRLGDLSALYVINPVFSSDVS